MKKKSILITILLVFVVILSSSLVFAEDATDNTQLQQDDNIVDTIQANETSTAKTETVTTGSSSSDIQSKIDSLSDGDTLNFEAGEYKNISIYVDKSITINGNGAVLIGYDTPSANNTPDKIKTTVPNGGYGVTRFATLFLVNTAGLTLNGLTFIGGENSGSVLSSALIYATNASNFNIYNSTFDGACTGIYLDGCPDGTIYNNTIKNQASTGILNFGSARTLIKENTVINAFNHGIDARNGVGPNVKIVNNTVIGSKEGIYLMHSRGHVATENNVINCTISSITCYGSSNIRLSNNKLQYSRIGVLLAVGYSNITIEENDYQLYRLPMPPIFTYYVAEAKSEYQGAEYIMGTFTDITKNDPYYTSDCNIPAVTEKVIDYTKLLTPTGETKEIPNGATSAEIQSIIDGLKDGDAIRFAKNGVYYNISIYTTKNIKIIGNNATLYGLETANMSNMPSEIKNLGSIYLAVLYTANNTNVSISDLNIISRYPDHKLLLGTTPNNEYKTAGIYAMKSENIVITNCKVDGASFGIMLHFMTGVGGCANAIVTNNYITNQYTYGILNFGSRASYIANNTVVNAKWHGIDVRHQMGPNVVVCNNTVIGSYEGIYLMHSHGHKVYNNTVKNSKVSSITVYGTVATKVNNIYVFNNTLSGSRIGILLGGGNQNVTIGKNTYNLDTQKSGDRPGFGIYLAQSQDAYSDSDNVAGTYSDKLEVSITVGNITAGDSLKITLTDSIGNVVKDVTGKITIDNKTYNFTTNTEGIAEIDANLAVGTYTAIIKTDENYFYSSNDFKTNVSVNKIDTALTSSNPTVYLQAIAKGYSYQITLKDASGKAIAGKEIAVSFNGVNYKATTKSNGVATVTLKSSKTGSLKATITFAGDDTYNAASKTATVKVTKEATKITAKKKTFKAKAKNKKYTITLKSKSGKVISKAKVTIKVKGKKYTAKTNSKGKATFNLKKLTKKGKHTATVSFAATKYFTKSSAKVKITIK